MKWKLAWLVVVTGVLTSCLSDPDTDSDPSQYYTSYFLFFDEDTQESTAAAIFTGDDENGFRQELKGASEVLFRKEQMPLKEDFLEYNLVIDGFVPEGQFTYEDEVGNVYANDISLKFIDFRSGLDSIFMSENWDFVWNGDPLEIAELVSLEIYDVESDFGEVFTKLEEGATKMTISKRALLQLGEGEKELRLTRERIIDAPSNPGVGGELHGSYKTTKRVVLYK